MTDKARLQAEAGREFLAKLRKIEGLDKATFRLVPSGESVLEGMDVVTLLNQLKKIMPELESVCEVRMKDMGEYGEEGRVLQITRIPGAEAHYLPDGSVHHCYTGAR